MAPVFVIALNIGLAASGRAPAIKVLTNELDAMADAARGRYERTKKLKVDVKEYTTDVPKGMMTMMETIQCTCL